MPQEWIGRGASGAGPCDPQFAGHSAEEVYDRVVQQARRYRKLATLRGRAGGECSPGSLCGAAARRSLTSIIALGQVCMIDATLMPLDT